MELIDAFSAFRLPALARWCRRTYASRHQVAQIAFGSASIAERCGRLFLVRTAGRSTSRDAALVVGVRWI